MRRTPIPGAAAVLAALLAVAATSRAQDPGAAAGPMIGFAPGSRAAQKAAEARALAVHVPGLHVAEAFARRQAGPGGDADEPHARFDEAASHQQVLAERVPAIALARVARLVVKIESAASFRAGQ